jgi:secreted trypsin-like serine protease
MRRLALVLLASCTVPSTGSTEQPIIGGALAPNDTATVLLISYPADKSVQDNCSAVVISPTMLLTAAHCIDAANHAGYTYGVFVDADASIYPKLVDILPHLLPVSAVHPHPSYVTDEFDIGIVELAAAVAIAPLPVQRTPAGVTAGKAARIVGYGQTVYNTVNQVRYAAATAVVGVSGTDSVIVGDATAHACIGDSGGPAIVDGAVIGVDSHGPTGCTGPSFYRRTDVYASFIDQYVPAPATGGDAGVASGPEAGTDPAQGGGGGCATTRGGAGALVAAVALLLRRRRREVA